MITNPLSMLLNNKIITLLIGLFLFATVTDSFSQRRSSRERPSSRDRDREQTEVVPFTDKLAFDILIGNPNFSNSGIDFSGKLAAGYKISDKFTLGAGLKYKYLFLNNPIDQFGNVLPDQSAFDYGFYVYPRYRISEQFYVKGEYNYFVANCLAGQLSIDCLGGNADKFKASFPMIGGGYAQGFGKWKVGIELMVAIGNDGRDTYDFFEYMFSFLHNL